MLFIYLIIHLYFIYALLLFSNSLKMIKAHRNMSELWHILCKSVVLTLVYLLFQFCEHMANFVSEPRTFPTQV